jgi:acetoin utilization protein AcuB
VERNWNLSPRDKEVKAMLLVKDLMTIDPDVVTPDTPLREVIALMNRCDIRQVPVVDGEQPVGIITDRDLRLAVNSPIMDNEPLKRLAVLDTVTAVSCMTPNPLAVTPDTPIYEAAGLLARHKFGSLLVVVDGRLEGIITVTDLLNQMALRPEVVHTPAT